jgi:KDO2-lipid IV(A) lauroyltransferase
MYYVLFAVLYTLSLLPYRVLYGLSDLLYLIIWKGFHYRKEVTQNNLTLSFPEKSAQEIQEIMNAYYRNLCDSIVETVKLMSVSRATLEKRMTCNYEIFKSMAEQHRNGQAYMSHQFNWEMATVLCNWNAGRLFTGIYLPLNSKAFDRIFLYLRGRSGTRLVKVQDMQQQMTSIQQSETLWGFIADQNPSDPKRVSWNTFLNRTTAFFKGPEFIARRYNNLVYFGEIVKIKRGYYEIKMKLAFENPKETTDGQITEAYVRFLEESIKRQPANWVWSHRRWKHIPPSGLG